MKDNPVLVRTVDELRKATRDHGAPIWRDVAERLERSRKNWAEVNLSRLARTAKKGETCAVPGVLLGTGAVTVPLTVAAFRVSAKARSKIEAAGGRVLDLTALAKEAPKGTNVRIVG